MLKSHIPILPVEISRNLIEDLKITHLKGKENNIIDNMDQESQYCIYTLYVLREIYKNVHFDSVQVEDLISETHKSMLMASIDDVVEYGLKSHLHSCFYKCKSSVFPVNSEIKTNFYRTELMIETFSSICHMPSIRTSEETFLCYMAAIFSLFLAADLKEYDLEPSQFPLFQSKLNRIWTEISKVVYYRNLMILYGIVHPNQKPRIHKEMLLKLWSSGGFVSLLFALQNSEKNQEDQPIAEIVEKLVANPSYSKRAQQSLEQQIFLFLTSCINNKDMLPYMGVGVACLRKLYDNNDENKELVKSWIQHKMQPLLEFQEDRITVMEWVDFTNMINLMFQIFCTSTVECMPSDLLICYLPVLIACHNQISIFTSSNHNVVCGHISSLVLRILNNRSKNELEIIIKNIITNTFPKDWFQIHPNITFEEDTLNNEYLRIIQKDSEFDNTVLTSYMSTLTTILKNSSFTTLTYQVFIILFRLLPTLEINEPSSGKASSNSDLLLSEDDIENRVVWEISRRYNGRIQAISALQILNEHKPLKNLIIENIKEILVILQEMLNTFTKTGDANAEDFNKSVIIVLLTLIREIVENAFIKLEDVIGTIEERLTQLTKIIHDKNLKYQILCLQKLIQTKEQKYENNDTSKNRFEDARVLIESKESYIQVEGIEKLIKLIKENDEFTVNNVHVVTALALNTLKSSESYTFLNCVRLFVSLVNINEHVILETLADDYLNESSPMDYRLLVGEALLRVCKEIGKLG